MNEVRNHQGITDYYERKAATARYGGFANVDELRTAYERMREDFAQFREQAEGLVKPLSPGTRRFCRSLVEHFRLQFLRELKRQDLPDTQRQHYLTLVAEGTRAAEELEREELRQ